MLKSRNPSQSAPLAAVPDQPPVPAAPPPWGTPGPEKPSRARRASRESLRFGVLALPAMFVNVVAASAWLFWGQSELASALPGQLDWIAGLVLALAVESIAIYLSYEAHVARMAGDAAGFLQLAAYGIAGGSGALNYFHWKATSESLALVVAAMSAGSPWLWSVRSRSIHRDALRRKGLIEPRTVRFSRMRWALHLRRTWHVLRLAVWDGETDPGRAIERFGVAPDAGTTTTVTRRLRTDSILPWQWSVEVRKTVVEPAAAVESAPAPGPAITPAAVAAVTSRAVTRAVERIPSGALGAAVGPALTGGVDSAVDAAAGGAVGAAVGGALNSGAGGALSRGAAVGPDSAPDSAPGAVRRPPLPASAGALPGASEAGSAVDPASVSLEALESGVPLPETREHPYRDLDDEQIIARLTAARQLPSVRAIQDMYGLGFRRAQPIANVVALRLSPPADQLLTLSE